MQLFSNCILFGAVIAHLLNQSEACRFQIWWMMLSLLLFRMIRPSNNNLKMATVITAVATCCWCKSTWMAKPCKNQTKMCQNVALKLWCAGKIKTNSQCRLPCWAWLAVYSLLEWTRRLSSCASLNLDDVSLSSFRSYAHCHGLTKAILFGSPVWDVAYSVVCSARCSKTWSIWLVGNHMDSSAIWE